MWMETAVSSPALRTRWMSPGGANPPTSPTRLTLCPAGTRWSPRSLRVNSSSCSIPCTTPNTHQVTWSWMRVTWCGRQTRARIEKVPSGSACSRRLRPPTWSLSAPPARWISASTAGVGRWRRSCSATSRAVCCQPACAATADRVAVTSSTSSGARCRGGARSVMDMGWPPLLSGSACCPANGGRYAGPVGGPIRGGLMSTSSPELLVQLDRSRPRSLRAQLEQGLRDAIRTGRLPPGVQLPSSRALATDLQVTRGVVVAAYELAAEGYLTTRQGQGTQVNPAATPAPPRADPAPPAAARARYDFRPGAPDVRLFRGVACEPGQVVVCNGVSHGLSLIARVLADEGVAEIAVEDPGQPRFRQQIAWAGARPMPVGVDGQGLRVDQLAASSAQAVLATPAHQYPTGVVLSPSRRRQLVDWAKDGGWIVEDDYDAEYRYDRQPVGALQGVAPDRVVYAGSLSKSLAPGLRLGWLVAPPVLRDALVAARAVTDRASCTLTQAVAAALLECGDLDRHLRRTRRLYRRRRDTLLDALAEHLPGSRVAGVASGLHVLVALPAGLDATTVAASAAEHGILLAPLARYQAHPHQAGAAALVMGLQQAQPTPDPAGRPPARRRHRDHSFLNSPAGPEGQAGTARRVRTARSA